jgi:hypothetical protein
VDGRKTLEEVLPLHMKKFYIILEQVMVQIEQTIIDVNIVMFMEHKERKIK